MEEKIVMGVNHETRTLFSIQLARGWMMCKKGKSKSFPLFFFLVFFLTLFLYWFLMGSPAEAVDELNLTGVLQNIDARSHTAFVQVKSKNCSGLRRFSIDDLSNLEGLEGKKIIFSINSSVCRAGEIYKITSVAPILEVRPR